LKIFLKSFLKKGIDKRGKVCYTKDAGGEPFLYKNTRTLPCPSSGASLVYHIGGGLSRGF